MNAMSQPFPTTFKPSSIWGDTIFSAKAVGRDGIVRRAIRVVEREMGRKAFVSVVQRCGFHLVECGGQFIVIGNPGLMKVTC